MAEVKIFKDQMGYEVAIPHTPKRVISLVPSQTELLFDLGLNDKIVGRTKFCIHPANKVKSVEIVGGTKKFRFDVIESLNPDFIIGNKEENYKAGIDQLKQKYPVWMSDIYTIEDSLEMIRSIGEIVDAQNESITLYNSIKSSFNKLDRFQRVSCLYFIWNDPKMVVGSQTFIDEMLRLSGFDNLISENRYPEYNNEELVELNPELILLSSEPFPFKEKHIAEYQSIFPDAIIKIVDGEMFSWYGSRLLKSANYIQKVRKELAPFF